MNDPHPPVDHDLDHFWMPFTANRQFRAKPRMLVSAKDMHYTTDDGRQVVDGCAGLWCVNAGHNRFEIISAIKQQLDTLDFAPTFQMGHPKATINPPTLDAAGSVALTPAGVRRQPLRQWKVTVMLRSLVLLVLSFIAGTSLAQSTDPGDAAGYPTRTVRLVVNAPPGGGTDILARTIAQRLSEDWGRQIVVDNRGGGGGVIGSDIVARAQPDGYTLLMSFTSHVINASLHAKLPYDTLRDFAPIAFVATVPNILVVHPSVPVRSVGELIAFAKTRPGQLSYASAGSGSASHLAAVLFENMTAVKLTHIPYNGGAPAQADVIGGQVALTFANVVSGLPHVRSGRLRGLATTGLQRSRAVPDLPTVHEAGVKGYEANAWFGLYAPAKVPQAIVARVNAEVRRATTAPQMQERLLSLGAETNPMTVAEFATYVNREVERWAAVVKASGARVE